MRAPVAAVVAPRRGRPVLPQLLGRFGRAALTRRRRRGAGGGRRQGDGRGCRVRMSQGDEVPVGLGRLGRDGEVGHGARGGRGGCYARADTVLPRLPLPGGAAAIAVLAPEHLILLFLADPPVPDQPTEKSRKAAPADDGDGRHALLEYADETGDEDGDGAHLLQYDGGVGDQGPELVGLEAGVAL